MLHPELPPSVGSSSPSTPKFDVPRRGVGRTGIEISEIGLGTWALGGVYYGPVEREQGVAAVRSYIDAGGNHVDTAFAYHDAEPIVGEAIRAYDRQKLIVASKSFAAMKADLVKELDREIGISLRDLHTDYIDLYYIHGAPHEPDRVEQALDAFGKLKEQGKVRSIGASIRGPVVDAMAIDTARRYINSGRADFIQIAFSVIRQDTAAMFAEAAAAGVGVICRSVLESGMITGKYRPGHEFVWPDQRVRYRPHERDRVLLAGLELDAMAKEAGYEDAAQLAIRYALADRNITSVILGAVSPRQVLRNIAVAATPPLDAKWVEKLRGMYAGKGERFNPTGELEHVPSPRD